MGLEDGDVPRCHVSTHHLVYERLVDVAIDGIADPPMREPKL